MTGLLFALLCLCLKAHQVTAQGTSEEVLVDTNEVVPVTLNISLADQLVLAADLPACVKKNGDTLTVVDKSFCSVYKDCQALYDAGYATSGEYTIKPDGFDEMQVYCEFDDCGGWIVIQRRIDGTENFDRNLTDYKKGFGNLNDEFWLGLDKIHQLTNAGYQKLRVLMANGTDHEWAAYSQFIVKDESQDYELDVGGYSGTAGDSLQYVNSWGFVAKDFQVPTGWACAGIINGGWWYDGTLCPECNLNAPYGFNQRFGIAWQTWKNDDKVLSSVTIKIRK